MHDLRAAGYVIQILQAAGKFPEKLAGIVYLVIGDPARPIVIDHMQNLRQGTMRPGKDHRTSERSVRRNLSRT